MRGKGGRGIREEIVLVVKTLEGVLGLGFYFRFAALE